jgi:hypothetical protein
VTHRSLFVVLTLVALGACAHAEADAVSPAPDLAQPPTDDVPAPFGVVEEAELAPAPDDPNVISFEDDVDAGPTTTVAAPPKRKHIPSFELFGTDRSDPSAPKMTLPDDVE